MTGGRAYPNGHVDSDMTGCALGFYAVFVRSHARPRVARALQKHRVTEVDMGANEFQVFSNGAGGQMHVLAHRLTDERRYEFGHRFLGDWLEGRK